MKWVIMCLGTQYIVLGYKVLSTKCQYLVPGIQVMNAPCCLSLFPVRVQAA